MAKFRAILITGSAFEEVRKGPMRKERYNSYEDLALLEQLYSPFKGRIVEEGTQLFEGDVDDLFL